jgi:hypothetical protein
MDLFSSGFLLLSRTVLHEIQSVKSRLRHAISVKNKQIN